jgi:hypothetical protein
VGCRRTTQVVRNDPLTWAANWRNMCRPTHLVVRRDGVCFSPGPSGARGLRGGGCAPMGEEVRSAAAAALGRPAGNQAAHNGVEQRVEGEAGGQSGDGGDAVHGGPEGEAVLKWISGSKLAGLDGEPQVVDH